MIFILRKRLNFALGLLFFSIFSLYSCHSQVPYPVSYEISFQKKLQAAEHWDILAEDVATQAKIALQEIHNLNNKPIYVKSCCSTPFEEIFQELLISHMVQKGLAVSRSDHDAIIMEYKARVVKHKDRLVRHPPLKYTALGAGLNVARGLVGWDAADLMSLGLGVGLAIDGARNFTTGDLSNKEVVISTALTYDERFLMHQSDIYYINEPDGWHYDSFSEKQKADNTEKQRKTFSVVN